MLIKNIQKILLLIGCILLFISIYYCNKYVNININNTIENFNDITVATPSYTHTPPILTYTPTPTLTPTYTMPTYTMPTYTIPSITLDSYTSITNPNMSSMPGSMSSMPGSVSSMPGSMSSMPGSMSSMPGSMSSIPDSMPSMPGMPGSMPSMPSMPGSMPSMPGSMSSIPDSMPSNLTYSNPTASNNLYISPINNTELYNPDNKLVMS